MFGFFFIYITPCSVTVSKWALSYGQGAKSCKWICWTLRWIELVIELSITRFGIHKTVCNIERLTDIYRRNCQMEMKWLGNFHFCRIYAKTRHDVSYNALKTSHKYWTMMSKIAQQFWWWFRSFGQLCEWNIVEINFKCRYFQLIGH